MPNVKVHKREAKMEKWNNGTLEEWVEARNILSFYHYSIIPEFHMVFIVLHNPGERGSAFPIRWE
jgi:hypothetical protein